MKDGIPKRWLKAEAWFAQFTDGERTYTEVLREAREEGTAPEWREFGVGRYYSAPDVFKWGKARGLKWKRVYETVERSMQSQKDKAELAAFRAAEPTSVTHRYLHVDQGLIDRHRLLLSENAELKKQIRDAASWFGDGLMAPMDILANSQEAPDRMCGVYFLIKDSEFVYIGQSVDILSRVMAHRMDKEFERFSYILCTKEALNDLEMAYIKRHKPPLNGAYKNAETYHYSEYVNRARASL